MDPFVVMVLSIGFIISVVALHSELIPPPYTHTAGFDMLSDEGIV